MRCSCFRRRNSQIFTSFIVVGFIVWLIRNWNENEYVIENVIQENLDIFKWVKNNVTYCGGNYTGYDHRFFRLKHALYNPKDDTFSIECIGGNLPEKQYWFWYVGKFGLFKYSENLRYKDTKLASKAVRINYKSPTVVIFREHAHNFYHAMTQWYGIYLISKVFGYEFTSMNILIIDHVAYNQIDDHWKTLFNNFTHTQDFTTPVLYDDIIFSIAGPESPMNKFYQPDLAYFADFSNMFLKIFGINGRKTLNCSNLVVVLSLRHDYIFHPEVDSKNKRNAERKFKNENELIETLEEEFKGHTVKTLLAENVPLVEQLRLATNTDILISMHGCTLTHTMFLPKHAAIFELYPIFWKFKDFYPTIARWSRIKYDRWRNDDKDNEFHDHYTRVPPEVFRNYARSIKNRLGCLN